jgi:hypothetical protein
MTFPNLSQQSDEQRINKLIESHPLLREKLAEIKNEAEAKGRTRIAELQAHIETLDRELEPIRGLEQDFTIERDAIEQRYVEAIAEWERRRFEVVQRRQSNRDRRRAAHHEIQELRGHRASGPAFTWGPAPEWFEAQVKEQKKLLPSTTFPPPMVKIETHEGNKVATNWVPRW